MQPFYSTLLEYELLSIVIEQPYEIPMEDEAWCVSEDGTNNQAKVAIEYDADGVPMGNSREEIEKRRDIVHEFIRQWRATHKDDPRVFNESINEYIRINQLFLLESVHHSVNDYKSTKGVMMFEEIMAKAIYVGDSQKKVGDANQKSFEKMIVMIFKSVVLGNVKMTVGVRNRTHEKVEYSITVPPPHTPFISDDLRIGKNKKKRKKHHK